MNFIERRRGERERGGGGEEKEKETGGGEGVGEERMDRREERGKRKVVGVKGARNERD